MKPRCTCSILSNISLSITEKVRSTLRREKGKSKKVPGCLTRLKPYMTFVFGIDRAHFEFALSSVVYKEVSARRNNGFIQWFNDVWEHWDTVASEYEKGETFSENLETNYKRAVDDDSMLGSLSEADKKIVLDAIRFDCDALLTVDRFCEGPE